MPEEVVPPLQPNSIVETGLGSGNPRRILTGGRSNLDQNPPPRFEIPRLTDPPPSKEPNLAPQGKSGGYFNLWDDDGFNFGDILDIFNPLQHVPIVSTIYRSYTGDDIGMVPRILGGAMFGGIIGSLYGMISGVASSLVNAILDANTGKDMGEHVYAMLFGEPDVSEGPTIVAAAASSTEKTTPSGHKTPQMVRVSNVSWGSTMSALDKYEQMARLGKPELGQVNLSRMSTASLRSLTVNKDPQTTDVVDWSLETELEE